MNDKAVVAAFVGALRASVFPALQVDRLPDDENRDSPDIDAIAGPLAIEHTSVDTLDGQRERSAWFMQVAGPLEAVFKDLGFRLRLVIPFEGISKGQDWNSVRLALAEWIVKDVPSMADGAYELNLAGVPFAFNATKETKGRPGLIFVRAVGDDASLSPRLGLLLARKAAKLQPYKVAGHTTVLLVDSGDIALMNQYKMLEAIRAAFANGLPPGVDQLWYADTSIESAPVFFNFTAALIGGSDSLEQLEPD